MIHLHGPGINAASDIGDPAEPESSQIAGNSQASVPAMTEDGDRAVPVQLTMPGRYLAHRHRDRVLQRDDGHLPGLPDIEDLPLLTGLAAGFEFRGCQFFNHRSRLQSTA